MKRFLASALAALSLLALGVSPAAANPLSYINAPLDTVQATVNSVVASINLGAPMRTPARRQSQ